MNFKKIIFRSAYPISVYLLITGLLLQGILMDPNGSIGKVLFNSVLIFLFFYLLMLRFACKLKVNGKVLEIVYFFPWYRNIKVDLATVESVDYAKGFYDPFSSQSLGGLFVFPKYCYDQFIFKIKGEDELLTLNVNTRVFQFDKAFKIINSLVTNKPFFEDNVQKASKDL